MTSKEKITENSQVQLIHGLAYTWVYTVIWPVLLTLQWPWGQSLIIGKGWLWICGSAAPRLFMTPPQDAIKILQPPTRCHQNFVTPLYGQYCRISPTINVLFCLILLEQYKRADLRKPGSHSLECQISVTAWWIYKPQTVLSYSGKALLRKIFFCKTFASHLHFYAYH